MTPDRGHSGARSDPPPACPFCAEAALAAAVESRGTVLAIADARPVSRGHLLVIPRRHVAHFFEMTAEEMQDALAMLVALRERALREDPTITGFNVGTNCGRSAGQRIMHAHIHFIPRRDGDAPRPGGVKGVIRNRLSY
jgi:diadenosine tetraphosphate (Ap4A) HIT family hydrolase